MRNLTIKRTRGFAGCLRAGLLVLVLFVIAGTAAGCSFSSAPKEKVFSSNGMNITLTEAFREATAENFTVAYDSKTVAVFALKEPFTLAEGFEDNTLDQYADLVIRSNGLSSSQKKTDNGLIWFEYDFDNPENKNTYHYFSYVYKAKDAFWLVQFATLKSNAEKSSQEIANWAKSVIFSD